MATRDIQLVGVVLPGGDVVNVARIASRESARPDSEGIRHGDVDCTSHAVPEFTMLNMVAEHLHAAA